MGAAQGGSFLGFCRAAKVREGWGGGGRGLSGIGVGRQKARPWMGGKECGGTTCPFQRTLAHAKAGKRAVGKCHGQFVGGLGHVDRMGRGSMEDEEEDNLGSSHTC